jgi:hypothetical protein
MFFFCLLDFQIHDKDYLKIVFRSLNFSPNENGKRRTKIKILCELTVKKEQYTLYINDKDGFGGLKRGCASEGINIRRRFKMKELTQSRRITK